MNPEIKSKFVAELRSGNWKQGKGRLREPIDAEGNKPFVREGHTWDGDWCHCANGVLAEMAVTSGVLPTPTNVVDLMPYGGNNELCGLVPDSLVNWSELAYDQVWQLVNWNDSGKTLEEIADLVEEQF